MIPKKIAVRDVDLLVLACPFCGSHVVDVANTHTAHYIVTCRDCGAEVGGLCREKRWRSPEVKKADHLLAIKTAVDAWNTRVRGAGMEMRPARLEAFIGWEKGNTSCDLGGTFGRPDEDDKGGSE